MNNEINYLNEIELALNVNFIKVIWNDKIKFKTVKIDNCFKCFFGTKKIYLNFTKNKPVKRIAIK